MEFSIKLFWYYSIYYRKLFPMNQFCIITFVTRGKLQRLYIFFINYQWMEDFSLFNFPKKFNCFLLFIAQLLRSVVHSEWIIPVDWISDFDLLFLLFPSSHLNIYMSTITITVITTRITTRKYRISQEFNTLHPMIYEIIFPNLHLLTPHTIFNGTHKLFPLSCYYK